MASCANSASLSAGHPVRGSGVASVHVLHSNGHISGTENIPKASGGKSQNAAISGLPQSSGSSLPLQVGVDVVVVAVFVGTVVDVAVVVVAVVIVVVVIVAVFVDFVPVVVALVLVRVLVTVVVDATQLLHMTGHPSLTAPISHRLVPSSMQLDGSRWPLQNGETVVVVVELVTQVLHNTGQSARNVAPLIGFLHTETSLPLHKAARSGSPPHVAVVVVVDGLQEPHIIGHLA